MDVLNDAIVSLLTSRLGNEAEISVPDSPIEGTEGFEQPVVCTVTVKSRRAIQTLIHLANEVASRATRFTLYPISTGQNWGYGSATPNFSDKPVVLLSLIELNEITYFDPNTGLCSIEPGVTQQQLFTYLEENNYPFMVPVTGAGPSCSILANALERGYGITPIADHFSAITRVEGVLPNGDYYTSSLSAMDKSDAQLVDKAFKWKHGPYLDGLFTQSGNMVVTEVSLSLARRPAGFDSFYLRFYGDASFERAYESIQQLYCCLHGVVGGINLMDKSRVSAMVADNPQGRDKHAVMSESQKNALSDAHDIPEWTVVGTLYGSKGIVEAAKKEVKRTVKGLADKCFFSNSLLIKSVKHVCSLLPSHYLMPVRKQLDSLTAATEIMLGKPNQIALPLAYWRNPSYTAEAGKTLHPAKDKCGLLWYAPLIPANKDAMTSFIDMVRSTTVKYNIEPLITFTHMSAHNIDSTVPIIFDLTNEKAKADAHACLDALFAEGVKRGFVPYRLNIKQQRQLDKNAVCWQTAGKIAKALDPNAVLSPTRYNPLS